MYVSLSKEGVDNFLNEKQKDIFDWLEIHFK